MTSSDTKSAPDQTQPWWRVRVMWLVVGGPSVVVVASFVTLALAIIFPDPVLDERARPAADNVTEQAGKGPEGRAASKDVDPALMPAMKARNHAATGGR